MINANSLTKNDNQQKKINNEEVEIEKMIIERNQNGFDYLIIHKRISKTVLDILKKSGFDAYIANDGGGPWGTIIRW